MERGLNLKELVVLLLKHFRAIVSFALVGAILFGGFMFVRGYASYRDPENASMLQQEYQEAYDIYEKQCEAYEKIVDKIKASIENHQEYMANSLVYRADAANAPIYSVTIAVEPLNAKPIADMTESEWQELVSQREMLIAAYLNSFRSEDFYVACNLASGLDLSSQFWNEVVWTDRVPNTNAIEYRVDALPPEKAELVAQAVIDGNRKMVLRNYGEHGIQELARASYFINSTTAQKVQNEVPREVATLANELKTATEQLQQARAEAPSAPTVSIASLLKRAMLYAFVGAALFAVVGTVFIIIRYFMSDKIQSHEDIIRRYNLSLMGIIGKTSPKGSFSKAVRALSGYGPADESEEVREALLLANIQTDIESTDEEVHLLLTGSLPFAEMERVGARIQKEFPSMTVEVGENCLISIDTLQKLSNAPYLLVLCKMGDDMRGLDAQLSTIEKTRAKLLGIVLSLQQKRA